MASNGLGMASNGLVASSPALLPIRSRMALMASYTLACPPMLLCYPVRARGTYGGHGVGVALSHGECRGEAAAQRVGSVAVRVQQNRR